MTEYDVPAQASRVAAMLDDLGLRRLTVAAHSSGGYIATALAEQRPDLVISLALVSTGPGPDALLRQPALLRALSAQPLGPLVWALRSDAMIRKGYVRLSPARWRSPTTWSLTRGASRTAPFSTVLRRNMAYIEERSVPERLAALDVPVLAIFGGADPRWDPSSARQYGAVPNARVELLPGVGHVPMVEAPKATSKLLLDFSATARRNGSP